MGAAAGYIPYIIAAVAAGTSYYNSRKTAERQDQIAAQGIRARGKKQEEIDKRITDHVAALGQSNPENERLSAFQKYMQVNSQSNPLATVSLGDIGGASNEYNTGAQDAALGVSKYGDKVADLMSRIDAPMQQRQREGWDRNNLQVDIGQIARASAGQDFINELRLRAVRPNPWLEALSMAAQSYSQNANTGGGAATSASSGKATGTYGGGKTFPF